MVKIMITFNVTVGVLFLIIYYYSFQIAIKQKFLENYWMHNRIQKLMCQLIENQFRGV